MKVSFAHMLEEFLKKEKEVVLATMVSHRGSAPQIDGAKVIVGRSGHLWGTVGGGKVEELIIAKSIELLNGNEKTRFFNWNLQKEVGMTCGGEVSFFIERFGQSPFSVAIFGAGHVSQALVRTLVKLDCQISCIDSRNEWLEKLPTAVNLKKILTSTPEREVEKLITGSFVLSMTQGHKFDLPILKEVFLSKHRFPYIGVIGSEQKAQVIKKDLVSLGVELRDLERLFCPIGLDFGCNVPEEIALSIAAQLIMERDRLS